MPNLPDYADYLAINVLNEGHTVGQQNHRTDHSTTNISTGQLQAAEQGA